MRYTLLALALVACTPIHENQYVLKYSATPRTMLWPAIEAARGLHYSIAAVESPDVFHNSFLAVSDLGRGALVVKLASKDSSMHRPDGFAAADATIVEVTPLTASTRADADALTIAIYDATRDGRLPAF